MVINMSINRGDIYLIKCSTGKHSSMINGYRPAIIVQSMENSTLLHVIPLTTSKNRHVNRFHIRIEGHGLTQPSIALIEQLRLIDKDLLIKRIGTLAGTAEMKSIINHLVRYLECGQTWKNASTA